jgi:hypothetical protein
VSVGAHEITASGGIVPHTAFLGDIGFHVDVPDGITEFTIRQVPIAVPALRCAALMIAGSCIGMQRRRR